MASVQRTFDIQLTYLCNRWEPYLYLLWQKCIIEWHQLQRL